MLIRSQFIFFFYSIHFLIYFQLVIFIFIQRAIFHSFISFLVGLFFHAFMYPFSLFIFQLAYFCLVVHHSRFFRSSSTTANRSPSPPSSPPRPSTSSCRSSNQGQPLHTRPRFPGLNWLNKPVLLVVLLPPDQSARTVSSRYNGWHLMEYQTKAWWVIKPCRYGPRERNVSRWIWLAW